MPKLFVPLNALIECAKDTWNNPPDWLIWIMAGAVVIGGMMAACEQNKILANV